MADPIRELLSQTSYDGDGVTTVFNFSFAGGYLDRSHVFVQLLNKATGVITQRPITNANFIGDFQLSLTPAISAAFEITIYRDTPKDLPLVNFSDTAALTEAALDLSAKQAIFVAAESSDQLSVAVDSVSQIIDFVATAEAAAVSATGSAAAASTSAGTSATQAGLASNAATLASQWAVQMGTPVSGADYSAKYNAALAAGSAAAAAASAASIAGGPVASVAGLTGIVAAAALKAALSLDNVTNESKAVMFASPVFTGNPTAPTAAVGDNDTSIATTAFVKASHQAPAFRARRTATDQLIATGVQTTILWNTEDYDLGNCYNPATGIWTPVGPAGIYRLAWTLYYNSANVITQMYTECLKNTTSYGRGLTIVPGAASGNFTFNQGYIEADMNGTTDSLRVQVMHVSGADGSVSSGGLQTHIQGSFVRPS